MKKKFITPEQVEQEEQPKRTQKEFAQVVAKAVNEINKIMTAIPLIEEFWWFNKNVYTKLGEADIIVKICDKYDVPYRFVQKVGGWEDVFIQKPVIPEPFPQESEYDPENDSIG